jgi:hypothetical protein
VEIGKDIVRTSLVVDDASSRAPGANAAAVPDSAPRDPAHDVTPSGMPHCKNVGSNARAPRQTTRNNPAEHSAAAKKLRSQPLGAGLRATRTRQLVPPLRRQMLTPQLPLPPLLLVLLLSLLVILPLLDMTSLALAVLSTIGPTAAYAGVPDAAALVPDAAPAPGRWPDTFGSTAAAANAWPPADRPHCNSVLADTSARTAVHIP